MSNASCPPVYLPPYAYDEALAKQDRLIKITTSTMVIVLAIPTMLANSLITWVIFRNKSLHTPSYILLFSLALTDVGVALVSFPFNAYWKILELTDETSNICKTFDVGFTLAFTFFSASELTVTALSVDRYLAVRLKGLYRATVTNSRVIKAVVFIWCMSVVWALTSVHVTPRVLHGTVIFVGIVTFGAIFICCGLSFKELYDLETKTKTVTASTTEQKMGKQDGKGMVDSKMNCCSSIHHDTQETASSNCQSSKSETMARRKKARSLCFCRKGSAVPLPKIDPTFLRADNNPNKKVQIATRAIKLSEKDIESLTLSAPCVSNTTLPYIDQRCYSPSSTIERSVKCQESIGDEGEGAEKRNQCKHDLNEKRPSFSGAMKGLQKQEKNTTLSRRFRSSKMPKIKLGKYKYTMMTLLWIVVLLILCYTPYFLLSITVVILGMTTEIAVAWSVTITCLCMNSFFNPVIYFWRFRDLRKACLNTLTKHCCKAERSKSSSETTGVVETVQCQSVN